MSFLCRVLLSIQAPRSIYLTPSPTDSLSPNFASEGGQLRMLPLEVSAEQIQSRIPLVAFGAFVPG